MRLLRKRQPRSGATVVETAVVIAPMLIFFFAIFEYGRFVMIRQMLENATREAARQAVVDPTTTTSAQVQNVVVQYMMGQPVTLTFPNNSPYLADPVSGQPIGPWTNAAYGDRIAVEVQANYTPMLPSFGFLPNPVVLKSKAIMTSEGN